MPDTPPPLETDVRSVQEMLNRGEDILLLDCREADEHATAHIAAARLIPMSQIQDRIGELEPYRQKHIVVHCHRGGRSMRVTKWLRDQGFANVQNMAGGIDQWSLEIDPSVPRY
jgi:rhodanese-related sulfurtransferase